MNADLNRLLIVQPLWLACARLLVISFRCQLTVVGALRFSGLSRGGRGYFSLFFRDIDCWEWQLFITLLIRLDKIQAIGEREARRSPSDDARMSISNVAAPKYRPGPLGYFLDGCAGL